MIVMKFGGTSVGTSARCAVVCDLIRRALSRKPLVVVSAHAGVTNALEARSRAALEGDAGMGDLLERHAAILRDLGLDPSIHAADFAELQNLLKGISLVRELSPKTLDYVMAFGERLSAKTLAAALRKQGIAAASHNAYDMGLVTDSRFGRARPLQETYERIRSAFLHVTHVPVVTGYIGRDRDGNITTLGRNGSDYSAAIFGKGVRAEEIQIWTDTDGVMTTNPSLIQDAVSVPRLSFDEAAELAYYGAKVLHPATLEPAREANIPVRVLNTARPEHPGTLVLNEAVPSERVVKSVAYKEGQKVVNVTSSGMLLQHGFVARIFEVFARHEIVIDMIATSEVSVSVTTDTTKDLGPAIRELSAFSSVTLEEKLTIVSVVGDDVRRAVDAPARVFMALARERIPVRMISEGASRINISLVIAMADTERAVKALHAEFFG